MRIAVEEGQQPLGWRDVPRDSSAIGRLARESEPVVRQLLVAQGPTGDERAFRRKLTVIRRRVELAAAARRVPEATFHIASFSSSTLTYKGLLTARQLPAYYADLREPEIETAMALVHSRFSTNTLGSWDLAHPFHYLAHNGEINTVRGNTPVDARARAAAALRPARRRPPQAVPADRRALERLGRARRRLRAARARRPRSRPRARDADPGRLEPGDADGGRPARVLRVPRRHARAVGRPGRDRVLRRTPGGRDARPQRPAALPLPGHARRPARARFRGRRARARPGRRRRQRPPAARPDADRRHRRRAHPRRRRDQARTRAPPPLSRAARRAEDLPRGHPLAAGRAARRTRSSAICGCSATPTRSCATSSRRWRATARSRSPRWASTRRWPRSRAGRGCCAASSSSSSRRSRTPPSTRSARRS